MTKIKGGSYDQTPVDGLLLDIGGVLYQGAEALPGAPEAMQRLRASGLALRFATNTSRTTRAALAEKLGRLGFDVAAEEIFTAPLAAVQTIRERGLRPLLLVHPDLGPDLTGFPDGPPDAVLIGDAGEHFDYRGLNRAFRLLMEGHRCSPWRATATSGSRTGCRWTWAPSWRRWSMPAVWRRRSTANPPRAFSGKRRRP